MYIVLHTNLQPKKQNPYNYPTRTHTISKPSHLKLRISLNNMNGTSGSSTAAPAPSPSALFQHRRRHHGGMMHMTFFWGKNTEVLFDGWPGTSLKMYWVCVATVFVFSALSEWLSRCGIMKAGPASLGGGLAQTVIYTVRAGLSYLIMLAVMSFNGGVFLAAMAGFGVGFLIFGSRSFKDTGINNNHTEVQSHC
ncbi:copper transporter 3-like [Brassica napus]|uniref:copper transporter 3-like n=1 Tax=Brassica napus TaxID=3708 RepID=UPI002078D6F0|nr:copper transporter 3-like [Brassica napus]